MSTSDPRSNPWRFPVSAAAVVTTAAHVPITGVHLQQAPYIGVLFIALEVAALVVAAGLLLRPGRIQYVAAALLGGAAVLAYALTRIVPLPQIQDDVGDWLEPLGVVAVLVEAVLVLGGLRGASPRHRPARRGARAAGTTGGAAVFGIGIAAVLTFAVVPPSGALPANGEMAMAGSPRGWDWAATADRSTPTGVTRTYYVSADEVVWDYAPAARNDITGEPFDHVADVYVQHTAKRIGSRYLKCLYRGYTDATFRHRSPIPADERYTGFLGPVLHAVVGDTIEVVYRNACPFPTSIHPHGVFYTKANEGAPYSDGTNGAAKADDSVPPGGRYTYRWRVPERAGPGPGDGSSVMWMYHSHTDEVADTYAGLTGPMVITRAGMARADGSPADVDREVFAAFMIDDEERSALFTANEHRFLRAPYPGVEDEEFAESNLKHSINGYLYGNMPWITLRRGQHVRWYVMDMGSEADLHTPHWHGNTVLVNGMRTDVISLLPATMVVADMVPDDPGAWLFHCHVADHITAGMLTRYRVLG